MPANWEGSRSGPICTVHSPPQVLHSPISGSGGNHSTFRHSAARTSHEAPLPTSVVADQGGVLSGQGSPAGHLGAQRLQHFRGQRPAWRPSASPKGSDLSPPLPRQRSEERLTRWGPLLRQPDAHQRCLSTLTSGTASSPTPQKLPCTQRFSRNHRRCCSTTRCASWAVSCAILALSPVCDAASARRASSTLPSRVLTQG
ncbi:hypothetical protein SAMN00790413_04205 [Deinococcus hopiensis KR-140]|uniref:Uncharacterized protein n=1 Tax=Deinococcus hopiensis KR-140 TaxID=695939 RepID=A0A1W1UPD4_9DEIO|nr:hypothetical protein SAMN00790413_04205 [Deinococcus hopiensis KR-140]